MIAAEVWATRFSCRHPLAFLHHGQLVFVDPLFAAVLAHVPHRPFLDSAICVESPDQPVPYPAVAVASELEHLELAAVLARHVVVPLVPEFKTFADRAGSGDIWCA